MAKTQIKNYVFKPGIGATDNLFPNAYSLLNSNKAYIQKEAGAYITAKIAAATQYTPTGATYAPATGVLVLTIGTHNFNVGDAVIIAAGGITFTNSSAGAVPFLGKALPVTSVTANATITVDAGISTDTSAHTWISSVTNATQDVFFNYTNTSEAKCERDIGYVVGAYLNDLRFGGNETLYNNIKYYWDQTVAQVDGDRGPEIATHNFIGRLIKDYIFANTAYSSLQVVEAQVIDATKTAEAATYTPTGATYKPGTGLMTITLTGHNLTVGSSIVIAPGGITFTCALDGNATLHPYPRGSGVPNTSGRDPYYRTSATVIAVTTDTVTINVGISSDTTLHTFSSAVAGSVSSSAAVIIDTFAYATTTVIANGLTFLPTKVYTGVGTLKWQGRYSVDEILLITNATRSEVIYNFTNAATGGSVKVQDTGTDTDFLKYLETTDGVTTFTINYDTRTHAATDDIQLFIEEKEVRTRPYDFGTDAIERPRAALPVSMLDADFEYGLQPTKWSAIGTMRGYPSVYEIPGTDASVQKVVTDASLSEPTQIFTGAVTNNGTSDWTFSIATHRNGNLTGADPTISIIEGDTLTITNNAGAGHPFYFKTAAGSGTGNQVSNVTNNGSVVAGDAISWTTQPGDAGTYYYGCSNHAAMGGTITVLANDGGTGIGQSLITVTTVGAHGFAPGTPVSLKALENSIAGASRAEGTFIIVNVPSTSTFQYFAKAKVGTAVGQLLSTGYTQLREAGFYTGASIGSPDFIISSNGSSGTMFTQLGVLAGENIIPFDGPAPEIGSPLSQSSIPLGSQVTGIVDQSAGGGTYVTPLTSSNTAAGQNQMTFEDATGVVDNLAVNRGDNYAIYVTSVVGNTATFNDNFTSIIVGNTNQYTNVATDAEDAIGQYAEFDISYASDSSNTYIIDAIENDGIQYAVGDKIKILGTALGGITPANDATITVTSVASADSIASATISGLSFDSDIYLTGLTATHAGGVGTGASFNVDYLDGAYTAVTPTTLQPGAGYLIGDMLVVSGGLIVPGTPGSNNDLYMSVDAVEAAGGNAIQVQLIDGGTGYTNGAVVSVTGGTGAGLELTISEGGDGIITSATISSAGTGYTQNDVVTLNTGGADATFRVSAIRDIGGIITMGFAGVAPNVNKTYAGVTYTSSTVSGTGATIDIQKTGTAYVATVSNGANYLPSENFTVAGNLLGGVTPGNDCTIVVDNVGGSGEVTVVTTTGLAANGDALTEVSGVNRLPTGATFNVSQNLDGSFGVTTVDATGTGYDIGQIHTISGTLFGGESPTNDLSIVISGTDGLQDGEITAITSSGTGYTALGTYLNVAGANVLVTGENASVNILRTAGNYTNIVVNNPGTNYDTGNRLKISGTLLDGLTPLNDLLLRVTGADAGTGGVVSFSIDSSEASFGANVDLISTVTMSDVTSGTIAKDLPVTFSAIATLQATFETAHGLVPGDTFITSVESDDGTNNHNLAAGSYIATEIPTVQSLRFQARTVGSINTDSGNDPILGSVFPRPDSFFVHRPFDGGVQLGTGGPQHGAQAIRQSKKYIRYQSGKGIMYTTGALFAPSYDIRSVTADGIEVGSEITIVTDDNDHGVQVGGIIRLLGVKTPGFNSGNETAVPPKFDYTVTEVIDERTFKVLALRRLGATNAVLGFGAQMSVVAWHGATVRSGIFDDQNGIFWEFDGTQINVVQRTGTYQVAGTIAIDVDKNSVVGTNTRFRDQLKAGDRIVIRGMTHVVSHVVDQTNMTVTPDFRGVTNVTGAKAMIVFDKRTKQADFNLDRLDGTGPSGYDIDIAKMQMIGIQYSWYGAGFIDFMLRGSDGNFVFAHRMRNSNVNTEAFMRSGNLPVRYEVTNEGPNGRLAADMTISQTTILLEEEEGKFFPQYGTVYIDNEIVQFTGRTGSTLTGCTRSATFTNFQGGSVRSYTAGDAATHSTGTGVVLISQTITPLISHWGSAFITDGGFDEDRGYIFSYAETNIAISTTKSTAFMIRLAPSVSNAIVGDLGERELLNRAQLLLQGLEITSETSTGGIVVQGVLNPQNYPLDPNSVSWQELSGVAQGGQPSFAQIAPGGGTEWSTGAAATSITADASANIETTAAVRYNRSNTSYMYLQKGGWEASGAAVGDYISGTTGSANSSFSTPKQIIDVRGPWGSGSDTQRYYRIRTENNWSNTVSGTVTLQKQTSLVNTSFAYLDYNSFLGSGAVAGTDVTGGSVTFPAGTQVSGVEPLEFGNTPYYKVSFNNTFTGTLTAGTGNIQFTFVQPPFAQPGETVFSFIANPGERSTLDLSQLKELTNTPLGGRGTFPNGPDVLAINVYKISGADVDSNIILKWGEAQA
jgi:plastocyanin